MKRLHVLSVPPGRDVSSSLPEANHSTSGGAPFHASARLLVEGQGYTIQPRMRLSEAVACAALAFALIAALAG